MAPHSSTLAWKIPWTEEPGRLQSMGSRRVGLDRATSLSLFPFMHWRRKWQPTPVFLPGESQRRGSLVGCRLWGCTESDTTEATQQQQQQQGEQNKEINIFCLALSDMHVHIHTSHIRNCVSLSVILYPFIFLSKYHCETTLWYNFHVALSAFLQF